MSRVAVVTAASKGIGRSTVTTSVFLAETPHIDAQTIVVDISWQKKIRAKATRS